MIRNLRILVAAAMALTAFGVVGATSAQAADEFHCSVEPCTLTTGPDGTAKNSHHVFIVENEAKSESVAFTCNKLVGYATSNTKTATDVTLTEFAGKELYQECTANGSPGVTVDMNGCTYTFTGHGGTNDTSGVHVLCPAGKVIQVTINKCVFDIPPQTLTTGIGYVTAEPPPNRQVTVTANVPNITVEATGNQAECLINPNQKLIGTYTTGNTLVTGETHAGVMAEAWYE
jgi:hypothetical protein